MNTKRPVVIACSPGQPLIAEALAVLLPDCDVRFSADGQNAGLCTTEPADLVIRYAPSTLCPPAHPQCPHQRGGTRLIIVSQAWIESENVIRRSGIAGYVGPNCSPTQIRDAVHAVLAGRFYYNSGNCHRRPIGRLSKRQVQVMALIAQGMTDQEIADRLHIAESTVRNHLETLRIKLSVERRGEIAAAAALAGLSSYGQGRETQDEPQTRRAARSLHVRTRGQLPDDGVSLGYAPVPARPLNPPAARVHGWEGG